MNNVNVKDYINPVWDVSDIVVEPSQELVEKWMPLMDYMSSGAKMDDEYIYFTPRVEPKDRLEVSRNLEFLERVYKLDLRQPWPQNDVYTKQMIVMYRKDVTEIKKKLPNVIVECDPTGCKCKNVEQNVMKIKLLHPDAKCPSQANSSDAGWDLYAINDGMDVYENGVYLYTEYDTGISVEPPVGYHTEVVPRSSLTKMNLILKNSIGIIDNGYRGNIKCRFQKTGSDKTTNIYKKGDRIAQMIIRKTIHMPIMVVDVLGDTSRGAGGFGSSGS